MTLVKYMYKVTLQMCISLILKDSLGFSICDDCTDIVFERMPLVINHLDVILCCTILTIQKVTCDQLIFHFFSR